MMTLEQRAERRAEELKLLELVSNKRGSSASSYAKGYRAGYVDAIADVVADLMEPDTTPDSSEGGTLAH